MKTKCLVRLSNGDSKEYMADDIHIAIKETGALLLSIFTITSTQILGKEIVTVNSCFVIYPVTGDRAWTSVHKDTIRKKINVD